MHTALPCVCCQAAVSLLWRMDNSYKHLLAVCLLGTARRLVCLDSRYVYYTAALLPVENCLLFYLWWLVPPSIPALSPGLRQRGPVHGRRLLRTLLACLPSLRLAAGTARQCSQITLMQCHG